LKLQFHGNIDNKSGVVMLDRPGARARCLGNRND